MGIEGVLGGRSETEYGGNSKIPRSATFVRMGASRAIGSPAINLLGSPTQHPRLSHPPPRPARMPAFPGLRRHAADALCRRCEAVGCMTTSFILVGFLGICLYLVGLGDRPARGGFATFLLRRLRRFNGFRLAERTSSATPVRRYGFSLDLVGEDALHKPATAVRDHFGWCFVFVHKVWLAESGIGVRIPESARASCERKVKFALFWSDRRN